MGLDSASVRTVNDLGEAFVKQYKYNVDMAPDRDQPRSMSQKDKETFKEYAQRLRELAAQITPPLEEKEMTKIFLKTMSSFYYERMITSAPSDFIEMVNMGMRLEEGVREGRLPKDEVSTSKKYGSSFNKRKDNETNAISSGRHWRLKARRNPPPRQHHHHQAELYPSLVLKNSIQPRNPPQIPEPLPWWYTPELHCAFHQGAPGHDIEKCYLLKYEVQKLMKSGMVSFVDRAPNVKANPLPIHGNSSVNMVDGCPGEYKVFDVRFIRGSLVQIHKDIYMVSDCEHDHDDCDICSVNPMGCVVVKRDIQRLMGEGMIQICQSRHVDDDVNVIVPVFQQPERLVIQYDSSSNKNVSNRSVSPLNGQEVPLPTTSSVVSITDVTKVTRNGRVSRPVVPESKEETSVGNKAEVPNVDPVGCSKDKSGESSNLEANDDDERVLEQAYVEKDVTVDQFDHIVANITSCNNLSFCDEELPEEGRNHNLALHISMNCKEDALSNVLVDTGSSLNVLPKSTLSKLSYQGAPMRYSGVIVKAFDGSRKTVIGEVDLPVKICPRAVTSTLHQKLKFVKNGKLVIVGGEKALLVSHLSSSSYVEAEDEVGTSFQALSFAAEKRVGAPMSSLKDAQKIVEESVDDSWGRVVEVSDNRGRIGLGFQKGSSTVRSEEMQLSFRSGGFIHGNEQHLAAVLEDSEEEDYTNFVTHGKTCNNWTAIDIPVIMHRSKLVPNPIEFLVFEAEEEGDVEVSDGLSRLLEQDEKIIQSFEEQIELVNLGFVDDVKEVKIGSRLCPNAKKGLIDLLREYSDVFAWSYQDMPGLDSDIMEHRLPLKPKCPPVKQKLRRTHPDMAVKIKEEVQKQIDAGFLVTAEYPQSVANIVPMPKKDGKVRMCVDYRDLNKGSRKMISLCHTLICW
ncbi:hypothetical protein KIW84_031404 [Lathyrus oleraceus]|uniref:Retrotransposon gag domain-containing protein n=1 Tax=Pisum sativum TaxID=3888 RepID=A0A9D4XR46_PEA|nr:hypothetical protein KIW84_031404 [Pisum sativum]